jgi:spore coat polysaccharide biosynthesis predicted glycosyltransferase SpsG
MKKNIFLRFDADDGLKHGLGHLYRSFRIYTFLKKIFKEYNFYIVTKKNIKGLEIIKSKFDLPILYLDNKFYKRNFDKNLDVFIIDTLGKDIRLIQLLSKKKIKLILFDNINIRYLYDAIIINGIFFAKKKIYSNSKKIKIFQGPKYIFLNNIYQKKKIIKNNTKILNAIVTSGGSDKKNFLYSVTNVLIKLNFKKIFVIVGKGVLKKNKIFTLIKKKNVILITNCENIKKYFDYSNVAFVSGGNVMFESIAAGKPTFVIKNYEHQKFAINFFRKLKCIYSHSNLTSISEKKIKKFLRFSEENYFRIFKKNIKVIDGLGFIRVQNIIVKYINSF